MCRLENWMGIYLRVFYSQKLIILILIYNKKKSISPIEIAENLIYA
jgi:hypothetical protein